MNCRFEVDDFVIVLETKIMNFLNTKLPDLVSAIFFRDSHLVKIVIVLLPSFLPLAFVGFLFLSGFLIHYLYFISTRKFYLLVIRFIISIAILLLKNILPHSFILSPCHSHFWKPSYLKLKFKNPSDTAHNILAVFF